MIMPPQLRKFMLTVHITSSVGWLGAVIAYLGLVAAAWNSHDVQTVRAAWFAMELTGWVVIVPLSIASLITGLVQSLGTKWGLFRHYWVLISFLLTLISAAVLLQHMPTVSYYADMAAEADSASRAGLQGEFIHAGGGLLILLVIQTLNVFKPQGVTSYGWRKQQEEHTASGVMDASA